MTDIYFRCDSCTDSCTMRTTTNHSEPSICPMGVGKRYKRVADWREYDPLTM